MVRRRSIVLSVYFKFGSTLYKLLDGRSYTLLTFYANRPCQAVCLRMKNLRLNYVAWVTWPFWNFGTLCIFGTLKHRTLYSKYHESLYYLSPHWLSVMCYEVIAASMMFEVNSSRPKQCFNPCNPEYYFQWKTWLILLRKTSSDWNETFFI